MRKLKLDVDTIDVASFDLVGPSGDNELFQRTLDCTWDTDCVVTGGVDSCWCSEYNSCECT
jgi:hypothetical protein